MCCDSCVRNIDGTFKLFVWFYTAQAVNEEMFCFVVGNQAFIGIVERPMKYISFLVELIKRSITVKGLLILHSQNAYFLKILN